MPAYAPNDSAISVEDIEFLHTPVGQALLDEVIALLGRSPTPTVKDIARLRRTYSADAVHAALTMAQLQPRARQKFPDLAQEFIYALPEALEQATDSAIAAHKAQRFAACEPAYVFDLCCGIGGDALALAKVVKTVAVDLSKPRLWCLRFNSRETIETVCGDVTVFIIEGVGNPDSKRAHGYFHIDPARRRNLERSARYEDMIPGPDFLRVLMRNYAGGAIKLSPAVDFDSLPEGHLEIISHNRSVVQAVLWTGKLAAFFPPNTRTATMFTNHQLMTSFTAAIEPAPMEEFAGSASLPFYLYELDPAFTRSHLAHAFARTLNLRSLTDDGGYLVNLSDSRPVDHAALTPFRVHALTPYSEKNVIGALQKHAPALPPGAVEVKTRGKIPGIDTDRLQVLFSKAAPHRQTVLIFRHAGGIYAAIAARIN